MAVMHEQELLKKLETRARPIPGCGQSPTEVWEELRLSMEGKDSLGRRTAAARATRRKQG
jgi:lysine/ornithine N-monooxygenase